MSLEWISCKGSCSGSDPTSDTVKINPALLAAQKENAQPAPNQPAGMQKAQEEEEARQKKEAERLRLEQENRRRLEEEAARKREEQLAAEREAAARAAAERAAAEKAAAEAAAEAAAAKEREEQRVRLLLEDKEKQRREQEAAEAQRRAQLEAAQEKVGKWCKANGYPDMNAMKKSFMSGSKFPIHEAVAKKNEEIVALLIQAGADKAAKNSKGQTAEDLARKMNKAGAMDAIIAQLSSA